MPLPAPHGPACLAVLAALGLTSCAEAPVRPASLDVPAERGTLKTLTVPPGDTDPAIDASPEPHLVAIDPAVPRRGQLFLLLGGQGYAPVANLELIARQAAANGFHAIALSYPRTVNVAGRCQSDPDETCFENVRLEVIGGSDRTPRVNINRPNSIENRVVRLLRYLADRFPGEGWSNYLEGAAPKWSMIRLGGHSEGGGHVALMAARHAVARVCLLESPIDVIGAPGGTRRIAPWIGPSHATPVDRYYGFRHLRSDSPTAPFRAAMWIALGLDRFGPPVDTDGMTPPYGNTHHLTTHAEAIPDGRPMHFHRSVAVDGVTPKAASGRPFFAPVWQYACFS